MNIKYLVNIQDGIDLLDKADDLWFEAWDLEKKIRKIREEEKAIREKAHTTINNIYKQNL